MDAPQIVHELAASVGGNPIAWHEFDDHWTIVMEDGRKLTFHKTSDKPRREQSKNDVRDYVGSDKITHAPKPHGKRGSPWTN